MLSMNFLVNYVEMLLTDHVANPECEMFMRNPCITFRSEHVHSLGVCPCMNTHKYYLKDTDIQKLPILELWNFLPAKI